MSRGTYLCGKSFKKQGEKPKREANAKTKNTLYPFFGNAALFFILINHKAPLF
jgi:hypothetical protein